MDINIFNDHFLMPFLPTMTPVSNEATTLPFDMETEDINHKK